MRKYREYSDSELREKFPEVNDFDYERAKYIRHIKMGITISSRSTGKVLNTIEEVEKQVLVTKLNGGNDEKV